MPVSQGRRTRQRRVGPPAIDTGRGGGAASRPHAGGPAGRLAFTFVNEFFEQQGQMWAGAARRRGAEIEAPELDAETAAELLELARVAAHTRERRFAPLSCYLAGVAAERSRSAGVRDEETAALIRDVRQLLERELPPPA